MHVIPNAYCGDAVARPIDTTDRCPAQRSETKKFIAHTIQSNKLQIYVPYLDANTSQARKDQPSSLVLDQGLSH